MVDGEGKSSCAGYARKAKVRVELWLGRNMESSVCVEKRAEVFVPGGRNVRDNARTDFGRKTHNNVIWVRKRATAIVMYSAAVSHLLCPWTFFSLLCSGESELAELIHILASFDQYCDNTPRPTFNSANPRV